MEVVSNQQADESSAISIERGSVTMQYAEYVNPVSFKTRIMLLVFGVCVSIMLSALFSATSVGAAPGGVSDANVKFWLKADAGVTGSAEVTEWLDQSTSGVSGTQAVSANRPAFVTNAINFNPVVNFAGTGSATTATDYHFLSYGAASLGLTDHATVCFVSELAVAGEHRLFGREFSGGVADGWSVSEDAFYASAKGDSVNVAYDVDAEPFVRCVVVDGTGGTQYLNGASQPVGATQPADTYTLSGLESLNTDLVVGGVDQTGANSLYGKLAELVVLDTAADSGMLEQMQSYLAVKYGVTLDQTIATDYVASDGTTKIWDAALNTGYSYNIAAIGADDASGLAQVKSRNNSTDALVTVIAEDEGTNAAPAFVDISDKEFLSWGHNNGTNTWETTDAPVGYSVLNRMWRTQETGEVGTVVIDITVNDSQFDVPLPVEGTDYYLIYDKDGNGTLSNECLATEACGNPGGVINMAFWGGLGDAWRATIVDFTTGTFAIGSENNESKVSGKVWHDDDKNGDDNAGTETKGLEGVQATLYSDNDNSDTLTSGDIELTNVDSSPSTGYWELSVPNAGEYLVVVDEADSALANDPNNGSLSYGPTTATVLPFTATTGDVNGIDFGFDSAEITFTVTDPNLNESGSPIGQSNVGVTIDPQVGYMVMITPEFSSTVGGITLGEDYALSTDTIIINPNTSTGTAIVVTPIDDGKLEFDEVIEIKAGVVTGASATGISPAQIVIVDDETATVQFEPATSDTSGAENADATINLALNLTSSTGIASLGSTFAVTVDYDSVSSTALPGSDITTGLSQTVLFESGSVDGTLKPLSFTLLDDMLVEGDETAIYNVDVGSLAGITAGANMSHTLTINDDEVASFSLNKTAVEVGESSVIGGTFTAVLDAQPTSDVNLTFTSSDLSEASPLPVTATFTPANWDVVQLVSVLGVNDNHLGDDSAVITAAIDATTSADAFDAVADQMVAVTVTDDDSANYTISAPTVVIAENGGTTSLDVVLTSQPDSDVVFDVSTSDATQATIAPAQLTFGPSDWNVAQSAVVTAVDDGTIGTGTVDVTASVNAAGSDNNFDGLVSKSLTVELTDDDFAGITIVESDGTTQATEAGETDTYTIALNAVPSTDVVINVTPDFELDTGAGVGAITQLTFTPALWNVPQTVTVAAFDNTHPEGSRVATITHTTTTTDPGYDGLVLPNTSVTILDNDQPGLIVTPDTLTIAENAGNGQFMVTLASQPATDVVLNVVSGSTAEATVSPATLTFTSADWSTAQNATVTGVDDTATTTDSATITVSVDQAASDDVYDTLTDELVAVTLSDNDTPNVIITESNGSTDVSEGILSDTYELSLTLAPTQDVTVYVTPDAQTDLGAGTGNEVVVIFPVASWDTPRTITVNAVVDGTVEGDHLGVITHSAISTDSQYSGLTIADVSANISDSDTLMVSINTATGQADPTNVSPVNFTFTFNAAIDASTFKINDITTTGSTAAGTTVLSVTEDTSSNGTVFNASLTASGSGLIVVDLEPGAVATASGSENAAPIVIDDSVSYDVTGPNAPTVTSPEAFAVVSSPLNVDVACTTAGETITITGSTLNNSPVTVICSGASTQSVSIDVSDTGNHTIAVTLTDGFGNEGAATTRSFVIPGADDGDSDGNDDETEEQAQNDGDGNGDGIQDAEQAHVSSTMSQATGLPTTLEITGTDCRNINGFAVIDESGASTEDADYDFPLGLNSFELLCGTPGGTASISIYLDKEYDTSGWTWRKLVAGGVYVTVDGVVYDAVTVGSLTVTRVTYEVTDGGTYDADGLVNGTIVDPAGPAVAVAGDSTDDSTDDLTATGSSTWIAMGTGVALIGGSLVMVRSNRKTEA